MFLPTILRVHGMDSCHLAWIQTTHISSQTWCSLEEEKKYYFHITRQRYFIIFAQRWTKFNFISCYFSKCCYVLLHTVWKSYEIFLDIGFYFQSIKIIVSLKNNFLKSHKQAEDNKHQHLCFHPSVICYVDVIKKRKTGIPI